MTAQPAVNEAAVLDALRTVQDPESRKDIVSLGLVKELRIEDSVVSFTLAFTNQPPAAKVALHSGASKAVSQIPGVAKVQVKMGGAQAGRPAPAGSAPPAPPPRIPS